MNVATRNLCAIPLPGLQPDCPGRYLASLGLLRLLARKWPDVRIAWKDGVFYVLGGPASLPDLLAELLNVAAKRLWTPYERDWLQKQKESTRRKSGRPLAEWCSSTPEQSLELFLAHAVPRDRVYFNPLLGSGGNAGKRAFSEGWKTAVGELQLQRQRQPQTIGSELEAFLTGGPQSWLLENLNAASWFSDANKLYNSGQSPYREGLVSPWAMALACEGLPFFAGSASRRLGARTRVVGAFPFVTQAAAPDTPGEAGRDIAELWAPIWDRPMTLPEVRALFTRGRAEVHGRGAVTPAAFASAIVGRGTDAGLVAFLRFPLGRTTSANTFEPRFEGSVALPQPTAPVTPGVAATALANAMERLLALLARLPRDQKKGQRWRFIGLRGPIERAMVRLAASPSDAASACNLLDAVVAALDKVDRNQSCRDKLISWEPLPLDWLPALCDSQGPTLEARLALAIVSGFPVSRPFTLYRFGVKVQYGLFLHPKQPPPQWVWGSGQLPRMLAEVLARRVHDSEKESKNGPLQEAPARVLLPASSSDVNAWLFDQVDEQSLEQWLSRFALFDWRSKPDGLEAGFAERKSGPAVISGPLALFVLFHPLFDQQPLCLPGSGKDLLDPDTGARSWAAARRAVALIRSGQLDTAVAFAMSRYAMAGTWLVKTAAPWRVPDPERLLASLLLTIPPPERNILIQRWLRPSRED